MTLQYNFATGQYEDDGASSETSLDLSGAYSGSPGYVLPDVSRGSPDMSPSTPTGNGTGYYGNPAYESSSWGDVAKQALQWVLNKDQAKNAQAMQVGQAQQYAAIQSQQAQVRARQNTLVLFLIVGAVVFFAAESK